MYGSIYIHPSPNFSHNFCRPVWVLSFFIHSFINDLLYHSVLNLNIFDDLSAMILHVLWRPRFVSSQNPIYLHIILCWSFFAEHIFYILSCHVNCPPRSIWGASFWLVMSYSNSSLLLVAILKRKFDKRIQHLRLFCHWQVDKKTKNLWPSFSL